MTDLPWIFTVAVPIPNMIRAPGLDDADNWDVEGFKDENWEATYLVLNDVVTQLREIAPEGTVFTPDTRVSVEVRTSDFAWFKEWYERTPAADMVHVWQTPTHPKGDVELYVFDKSGVIG